MFSYSIDRIPNAGITVAGELPRDTVAFLLGDRLRPGAGPFPIRFEVAKRGTNVLVDGTAEFDYAFECGRCADTFQRHDIVPIAVTFMEGAETLDEEFEGETYDVSGLDTEQATAIVASISEREVIFYEGKQIELEGPISEQIVLHLPSWPLCMEDCKGLCATCGKNQNTELCTCATDVVDPRWASLAKLKAAIGDQSQRS